MCPMSRRRFLQSSAALAAGAAMGSSALASRSAFGAAPMTADMTRTLGKTGIKCSLLGFGTGVRSWNHESALTKQGHASFMGTLEHAYGNGVRFLDCADMYGSHPYIKEGLKSFVNRDETMIMTKSVSRDAEGMKADLERFRKELDTDVIDVVLMHCLTDQERDWTTTMQATMDVMEDAKAKGIIRAHGCSCHDIGAMRTAVASDWTDVMLARINPFGIKMDGTPDEIAAILQEAHDKGKGVLGMKILGEGTAADRMDESLKFVTGLGCVDAMTIGFLDATEIDGVMGRIKAVTA